MGCRDSLKQLEIRVCDASDPSRVRVLAGSDPSCAELRDRITLLEVRQCAAAWRPHGSYSHS